MILKIDMNDWQTIRDYAKENGVSTQVVSGRIKRGKLESIVVPELNNLKLVKRNVNVNKKGKASGV